MKGEGISVVSDGGVRSREGLLPVRMSDRAFWLELRQRKVKFSRERENSAHNAIEADEMQFGQSSRGRKEGRGK